MMIKKYFTKKIILIAVAIVVVVVLAFGVWKHSSSDSKTTKLGFENIGELATQAAYCTEVNVTDANMKLFGIDIPFTQSKYIYSYDIAIKAGFDFNEITYKEEGKTIKVVLPQPKILSSDINLDSFKIYHESESIFRQISMTENNEALTLLKSNAEKDAEANGLLENAKTNAEAILTGFFASHYSMDEYQIEFEYK